MENNRREKGKNKNRKKEGEGTEKNEKLMTSTVYTRRNGEEKQLNPLMINKLHYLWNGWKVKKWFYVIEAHNTSWRQTEMP